MRDNFEVKLAVDDSEFEESKSKVEAHVEDSNKKFRAIRAETKKSFNEVMGAMRASYMIISGVSQAVGGDMGQVFSALYSIGVAAIGTYTSIAAAIGASSPLGWIQAGIMMASLVSAMAQLGAVSSGLDDLNRSMNGITMALHGLSGLFTSFSL